MPNVVKEEFCHSMRGEVSCGGDNLDHLGEEIRNDQDGGEPETLRELSDEIG